MSITGNTFEKLVLLPFSSFLKNCKTTTNLSFGKYVFNLGAGTERWNLPYRSENSIFTALTTS